MATALAVKSTRQRIPRFRSPPCPHCCSEHTCAIRSRIRRNGTRRRRHECQHCGYRWTVADQSKPLHRGGVPTGRDHAITPDEVKLILTSELSNTKLAEQLGVTAGAISRVRVGRTHRQVHPDLPRRSRASPIQPVRSCLHCQSWDHGRCLYGFPDPQEEGPSFAMDCDLYATPSLN